MRKIRKGEVTAKQVTLIKGEKELLRSTRRLTNIRQDYLHQTTTEMINRSFLTDFSIRLSDRIYKCGCGNVIDRDYQAALNLKRYGEHVLQSVG